MEYLNQVIPGNEPLIAVLIYVGFMLGMGYLIVKKEKDTFND